MANQMSRAQLVREINLIRKDLVNLTKVVVQNRRLIAFLEWTRSTASWSYTPVSTHPTPFSTTGGVTGSDRANPPYEFDTVSLNVLIAHHLRGEQL